MTIAVDFDGTIVEHRYPEIGKEIPFATTTLKKIIADGHRLVLWSVREGEKLEAAIEWCRQRGVIFYEINKDFDDDTPEKNPHFSRKLKVDLFIDDRNVGGLPDWGIIYELVKRRISYADYLREQAQLSQPRKKHWWSTK